MWSPTSNLKAPLLRARHCRKGGPLNQPFCHHPEFRLIPCPKRLPISRTVCMILCIWVTVWVSDSHRVASVLSGCGALEEQSHLLISSEQLSERLGMHMACVQLVGGCVCVQWHVSKRLRHKSTCTCVCTCAPACTDICVWCVRGRGKCTRAVTVHR